MAATYHVVWTTVGLAKRAAALAGGARVQITEMALGETDGSPFVPDPDDTALVSEVWRGDVNALEVRPPATTVVTVEAIVDAGEGPWTAGQVGLFDATGALVAHGCIPNLQKTVVGDGALTAAYVRVLLEVVDPDLAVDLIVDPAVVMASREYVDEWSGAAQHYAWMTFR